MLSVLLLCKLSQTRDCVCRRTSFNRCRGVIVDSVPMVDRFTFIAFRQLLQHAQPESEHSRAGRRDLSFACCTMIVAASLLDAARILPAPNRSNVGICGGHVLNEWFRSRSAKSTLQTHLSSTLVIAISHRNLSIRFDLLQQQHNNIVEVQNMKHRACIIIKANFSWLHSIQ